MTSKLFSMRSFYIRIFRVPGSEQAQPPAYTDWSHRRGNRQTQTFEQDLNHLNLATVKTNLVSHAILVKLERELKRVQVLGCQLQKSHNNEKGARFDYFFVLGSFEVERIRRKWTSPFRVRETEGSAMNKSIC